MASSKPVTFYRDHLLGVAGTQANDEAKLACLHKVTEEVAAELKQIHDFNAVVCGHLKNAIDETETAASGIVERLQTIDVVVTCLDIRIRRRNRWRIREPDPRCSSAHRKKPGHRRQDEQVSTRRNR